MDADDLVDSGLDDLHGRRSVRDHVKQLRKERSEPKKRTEECRKCYGQGQVPDDKFCGSAKPCPECEGTGKQEFDLPETSCLRRRVVADPAR
ncbi:MAG TPA: hypothetical protein DDW52_11760, partial [Planctomycetaceae bacterium]|nr:hypothetical protein [Planctomycetaceae bacterium]